MGKKDSQENGKLKGLKSSSNAAPFPGVAQTFPCVLEETCQAGGELQGGEDLEEVAQEGGRIPAAAGSDKCRKDLRSLQLLFYFQCMRASMF